MKKEEIKELSNRLDGILKYCNEWDIVDQMAYMVAVEDFLSAMKPIIEKYDPQEPFKFEIRPLNGAE